MYDILVVTGPTASGKTSLAVALASRVGGEIISADSRQVYRGMNLGTGKDYDDYLINGSVIPYHLIDIADPGYKYNVFEYQRDFNKVYTNLKSRKVFPVVCGGSGMYADSIISGYKMVEVPPDSGLRAELEKKSLEELRDILSTYKSLHNITDIDTKKRVIRAIEIEHFNSNRLSKKGIFPKLNPLIVGILFDRDCRRKRITERLKQRLDAGMVDEVKLLIENGVDTDTLLYYGLEYKYITLYLTGKLTYEKMVTDLEIAIHQFAKRQMTWFRGMEKRGTVIHWLDGNMPLEEKLSKVIDLLI
ncbi:MAG: tRNA (adenosine(37)-N6)-dimethylallyltransferase MiaA [Bacteroidales bacterium]|nr:tRNA (adenosine(37)-N6)-dimethylallyltransferase MiaA [Bacteroidales bacterium]MBK7628525.1 tRNA (adenosine(37)-N6)-dimethylallyltransferase MiaA [Bacteroidales bacterium]